MLIRNTYLDDCLSGKEEFSSKNFISRNSLNREDYRVKNLNNIEETITSICIILIKQEFKEDLARLKKTTFNNILKVAFIHDVNIYEELLYIYASIVNIPKLATLSILGQPINNTPFSNYYYNNPSTESIKEIYEKLIELKIIE